MPKRSYYYRVTAKNSAGASKPSNLVGPVSAATQMRSGLSAAAKEVGDPELARWLTEGVPGAIVAGAEPPQRP